MEPGICYIKKEYLLDDVAHDSDERKRKINDDCPLPENKQTKLETPAEGDSAKKPKKKVRNRGQNKHRPVFKEDRFQHLCRILINGPSDQSCELPNCRYVHDLTQYLATKGKDIGPKCYVFETHGFCPRGVTCRFAKHHLDAEGRNITAAHYDPTKAARICNGITPDTQTQLRRHLYDFSRSKGLAEKYQKLMQDKGATEAEEKPVGAAVDDAESPGRDVPPKPPINFADKLFLSPLTTVGNLPYRRVCKEFGADVTCGEMACAVPLISGMTQEWALTKRHESEDIFGVQLCGNNAPILAQMTQLLQETTKVDFIDLNIGCPIDLIYRQGGGSAFMRRPNVLEATVRSCAAFSPDTPFTVKMRTGVYADKSVAHTLMPLVEEWGAAAVTLHGRSREQRYTKNANWEYIEECASKVKQIPVIGNGDILTYHDFQEKRKLAPHVSSVMIGRGALIKPWIFKEIKDQKDWDPSSSERYEMMQRYVNYGLEHWGSDTKGVETTRRFLLEWQSFLYRYIPYELLATPPQKINQRPQKFRGRDEMETLMSSPSSSDWVKLSEMLLGPVPEGFHFMPKHKANSY